MTAYQFKPRTSSLVKPVRDKKYIAWLRTQQCLVCRRFPSTAFPIEAAHSGNNGAGMGQKATDLDALPLCGSCHRTGRCSYHSFGIEAHWADFQGIDLALFRRELQRKYEAQTRQPLQGSNDLPGDAVAECGR